MKRKTKIIAFLLILAVTLNIHIGLDNKYFLHMGIGEVEAASTRVEHIKLSNVRIYNKSELEDYRDTYSIKTIQSIEFNIDDYIDREPDTNVRVTGSVYWRTVNVTGSSVPVDEKLRLDVFNTTLNGWDNDLTYNNGSRNFSNTTLNPYELIVKVYFSKDRYGYYSPRTWTAQTYIDIDLTVEYTPNNSYPTLTLTQPSPNSPFSAVNGYNTINISGTITDADSGDILKTYYRIDGTAGQTGTQFGSNITANGSAQAITGNINVSSLSEGNHTLYVWVEDDKGGKSSETAVAFKIDKTAPTVTFGTNGNTTPKKTHSTTVTVTDPTSNGVTTSVSTRQYQWTTSSTFPTSGTWTNFSSGATLTQPNGNGDYYLHIKAVDAVGNTRQATSNKFALDNTAPTVTLTHNHADLIVRDADTVTITATFNEAMASSPKITISNVGITNVNMTMGANNKIWTYKWDVPSSYNGTAVVTVSGTDLAGNAYSGTNKITFTVDNIAPTLTISSPSATQVRNGTNVTYTVTYSGADFVTLAPGNITLNKTGTANGNVSVTGSGTVTRTVTISNITGDGTLGISIAAGTVSDTAGNTSAAVGPSTTFTVDNTAPTVNAPTVTAIDNQSIEITPSALDPTTGGVAVGLHSTPYTYNRDGIDITTNEAGDYIDSGLEVNTAYTYKYKAKDKLNNESNYSTEITRYTLANVPSLSLDSSDQTTISGSISLNGNPSNTETYVERAYDSGFTSNITMVKNWNTDNTFIATGLMPGKTYYFRVKARNGDNIDTAWSSIESKITIPATPNAPTATANVDPTRMDISWTSIEGATEYILYRNGEEVYRGNDTAYVDSGLASNTAYTYSLKAKNESGETPEGTPTIRYTMSEVPAINITEAKQESIKGSIDIKSNPSYTETYIERSTASDFSIDIEVVKTWSTETSFEDTGLLPGKIYYYRVKARNGDNIETAWSNSVSKITIPDTPNAPTVTANDDSTKMNISWTNIEGATEYILYRDGAEIYRGNGTSYTDSELTPNTAYNYTLKAVNESGVSPEGTVATKYTRANNPLSIVASNKEITTVTFEIINDPMNTYIPDIMIEARRKDDGTVVGVSPYSNQLTNRQVTGLEDNVEYEIWARTRNNDGVENDYYKALDSLYSNFRPQLIISNNGTSFIITENDGFNIFSITGKAYDQDNEKVVIKATIGGVEKVCTVDAAPTMEPSEDNWTLTWNATELPEGEYSNIQVTVEDAKGSSVADIFTGKITVDKTPPTAVATLYSSNTNTAYADVNDTISLAFSVSEPLKQLPVVKIAEKEATVTDLGSNQYKASYTLTDTDSVGYVKFSIEMVDLAGNKNIVTATTDDSRVFFYNENAYKDIETVEDAIDLLENLPSPATQDKRDEIAENIVDKVIALPELTVDDILDVIDAIPREPVENAVSDEKANELIEKLIEKAIELAEDNEDLEKIKEVIEDSTLPDEVKDRLIDEITDRENLNNVDIDDSQSPPVINLEPLSQGREYRIEITDIETNEIIRTISTPGGTPIEVAEFQEGKTYRIKIDIVKIDDETVIATRTFIITIRDITPPEITGIYILNGQLTILAKDNVELHETAYAFRVIQDGENVDEVESSILDTTYNSMVFTTIESGITTINYQKENNVNIKPIKTVITIVRDATGNLSLKTVKVTKENENLFGEIPPEIKEQINRNNTPPKRERDDDEPEKYEPPKNDIVIIQPVSDELKDAIEGTLEDDNLIIDVEDTEANSQKGKISINIKKDLEHIHQIVKDEFSNSGNVYYRINITEKATNRLVYTKLLTSAENIIIPDLQDSTAYIIKIFLVHDGKELAFRTIEKMTYDKTPPTIEQILVKGSSLEVLAHDNYKLHEKAYQYLVNNVLRLSFNERLDMLLADNNSDETFINMDWGANLWTESNKLNRLDTGAKVRVIVRDASNNYTVADVVVKDGATYNTINSDNPMPIQQNDQLSSDDLIEKIINEYNAKNPDNQIEYDGNPERYEITTSNPNTAAIENGRLIAKSTGRATIIITDKETGASYRYSILVTKYAIFDRRIVVQTKSQTELLKAFEKPLYAEFLGRNIAFYQKGVDAGKLDGSVFIAGDEENIATIIATDGQRQLPLYIVIVKDNFPESNVELIVSNVSYVLKVGDIVNIKDVSTFYDELINVTDTDYLVVELGGDVLRLENRSVVAVKEGRGSINIIDLANNRIEQIDLIVTDYKTINCENNIEHWAKTEFDMLANKGILTETYKDVDLNEHVSIKDFLIMLSRAKAYYRDNPVTGRNNLPLDIKKNESYYYVMDALNNMSMFEVETIFGDDYDLSQTITREQAAAILALTLRLDNSSSNVTFKDIEQSKFKTLINAVREHGLMRGIGGNLFAAEKDLSFGELCKIISNIDKNKEVVMVKK